MRFLMGWVVIFGLGCAAGCGSSGTSPVVEYNAASEAIERDTEYEKEVKKILKDPELKPEDRKEFEDILKRVQSRIESLRAKAKESGDKI